MAIHLPFEEFDTDALLLSLRDKRHLVSGGACHGQLHLVAGNRAFVDDGAALDGDLKGDLLAVQRALLNPALVFPDGDLARPGLRHTTAAGLPGHRAADHRGNPARGRRATPERQRSRRVRPRD